MLFALIAPFATAASPTTTTLSVSPSPARLGQTVTLTATVTPVSTGQVTFYDGVAVLGIAPVSGSVATLAVASLASGKHSLTARYDGTVTNSGSLSAGVTFVVQSLPASNLLALPAFGSSNAPEIQAIAVDLNNDRIPDLITTQAGSATILRGTGNGTFTTGPTYMNVAQVAAADFNGDGIVDLAMTISNSTNIQILLGVGDGTFSSPTTVNLSGDGNAFAIQTADLNGDGKVDLVVSLYQTVVAVLLGNGDGTFGAATMTGSLSSQAIFVADINGDGKPDLVMSGEYGGYFLAGNGDGTFAPAIELNEVTSVLAIADFNGDGKVDLLVQGYSVTSNVLLGNGDGTFAQPVYLDSTYTAVADFNGDGKLDVLSAGTVSYGNGDGTFQPGVTLDSAGAFILAVADLNNNGQVDLITQVNNSGVGSSLDVFLGTDLSAATLSVSPNPGTYGMVLNLEATVSPATATGTVTFYDGSTALGTSPVAGGAAAVAVTAQFSGRRVLTAQYSGDNVTQPSSSAPQTVVVNGTASSIAFTANTSTPVYGQTLTLTATVSPGAATGSVTFFDGSAVIGAATLHSGIATFATAILNTGTHSLSAQYDGGGAFSSSVSPAVFVTVNSLAAGTFSFANAIPLASGALGIYSADLNGDGDPDLIVTFPNSLSVYLATGNGSFAAPATYTVNGSPLIVIASDLNNDGIPDLVVETSAGLNILLGSGNGVLTGTQTIAIPSYAISVADYNRDGRVDILVASPQASAFSLLFGNGDGSFAAPLSIGVPAGASLLGAADLNNDGNVDLVVQGGMSGVLILLGKGDGTFGPPAAVPPNTDGSVIAGSIVAIGDVNRDGKPDLIVGNGSFLTVLLGNGNGTFTIGNIYGASYPPSSYYLVDANGDGNLDIIIPLGYYAQVALGNGDGTFHGFANAYLYGSPLAIGDFFQDGRVSVAGFAFGNLTLYSGIRPSSIQLSVDPNPGTAGQPVTVTATLSPSDATGSVTFNTQLGTLGTSPVVSGTAVFTTSALPVNRTILSASYTGDSITSYGSSNFYFETVTGIPSTVSLTSSATAITFGRPVVLTATLTPPAATGVVTFLSGAQVLGSSHLQNGVATFTTSMLPAGAQTVRAIYEGDTSYTGGSASNPVAVQVTTVPASTYRYEPINLNYGEAPVAAADFNGDGIPDLLVESVSGNQGQLMVLTGRGDGTFAPGWQAQVGLPQYETLPAVTVADFNGDGKPDIAVMNYFVPSVSIYLNQGDGTFVQATGPSYEAFALTASDFNGDGIPDLLLLDTTLLFHVFIGNGDGTFVPYTQGLPAGNNEGGVASIVAGDFNGDGKIDVAISGYTSGALAVFLGNGDASFQSPVSIPLGSNTGAVIGIDLNRDGIIDLAVLTGGTYNVFNSLAVLIGNGNGTFQAPVAYTGATTATNLATSDFNGDGFQDLAIDNQNTFAMLYGNGDGTLQSPVNFTQPVNGVVVADYNGDGRADLPGLLGALADSITLTSSASSTVINQLVTFTATVTPSTITGTVTFYDGATVLGNVPVVNGVATLQVYVPATGLQQITAKYLGDPNYNYASSSAVPVSVKAVAGGVFGNAVNYPAGLAPSAVITGDFNNDGKLDIAVANKHDNSVTVLWGSGGGAFGSSSTFPVGNQPLAIASGDFNGDGVPDIAVVNSYSNSVSILLSSNGTLVSAPALALNFGPSVIAAGDFNGDGRVDLVVTGGNDTSTFLYLGNGDGSFTAGPSDQLPGGGQVALGDFNGDANPDVLLGNVLNLGDGHGNFSFEEIYLNGSVIAAADFNNDGKLDIAFVPYGTAAASVMLGNGDGTFQPAISTSTPVLGTSLAAGDFNGDGIPDLALVSTVGNVGIMIGNGDGSFEGEITYLVGTLPTGVAVGDFDGDGRLDLAVSNAGTNNVSVLVGAPSTCTYSVSPASFLFQQTGGNATVTVTASAPTCTWAATFTQSYSTTIVPPTSQTGNGQFTFLIPYNSSGSAASGTINVGNQRIPVTIDETVQVFADVPVTAYYFDAVNLLSQHHITSGCDANDFCPTETITRAQMAIFIVRGILGTDSFAYTQTPYFTDVPAGAYGFQWIQKLRDLGITTGCAATLFCPDDGLTRAQAAVFLIRARYGATTVFPYSTTPYFTDVPADGFGFEWIQRLKADNITSGCTPTTFCPNDLVIRGDMAIFIMRALFNQLLTPNQPEISSVNYFAGNPDVSVNGLNTHFNQSTTQVSIPGMIVSSILVYSPTRMDVYVTRDPSVPAGPESVLAITGQEVAVGPNQVQLQ